ncbi:hypothetical protein [Spirosoma lituiforme]
MVREDTNQGTAEIAYQTDDSWGHEPRGQGTNQGSSFGCRAGG